MTHGDCSYARIRQSELHQLLWPGRLFVFGGIDWVLRGACVGVSVGVTGHCLLCLLRRMGLVRGLVTPKSLPARAGLQLRFVP